MNDRLVAVHNILSLLCMDEVFICDDDKYRQRMKEVSKAAHVQGLKRKPKANEDGTPVRDMVKRFGWSRIQSMKINREGAITLYTTSGEDPVSVDPAMLELIAEESELFAEELAWHRRENSNGSYRRNTIPSAKRDVEFYWELEEKTDGAVGTHRVVKNMKTDGNESLYPQDEVANVEKFGKAVFNINVADKGKN